MKKFYLTYRTGYTLWNKLSWSHNRLIMNIEDEKITYNEIDKKMPIRSRILASHDGLKKLINIDKTLEKYSKLSSSDLVKLTHKYSTPWSLSGEGRVSNKEIKDLEENLFMK